MRKKIALLLCTIFAVGMIGCGSEENAVEETAPAATAQSAAEEAVETTEEAPAVEVTDSLEILTSVWETYDEADKFAIGGGDSENMTMDTAGAFDVEKIEELDAMLGVPADAAGMISEAASMMHMMNANTFTSGAYHLTDAANKQAFADLLKDNIMNRQWMCGFPDTLLIVSVGDEYMVSAFGEAQIMETFKTKLLAQYEAAEVIYEESLAE